MTQENTMKVKSLLFLLVLFATGLVAGAQQVSVNFNNTASFANYHTYAWGEDNANKIKNSILAQVAVQNIDTAMQAKGFQKVALSAKPDLIVTANGGLRETTTYTAMGMRGFGGGMGSITPQQNVDGTLIVDLYTTSDQSLVWRGIATNTLSTNGDKNQKIVVSAVQKMFKKWPKS
jgi:hypothetical protein